MDDKYLYKCCYSSSDNERLQVSQSCDRLYSIMKASEIHGDNLHSDFQTKLESDSTYQGKYHKSCVTKYLTKATRSAKNRNKLHQVHPIYMRREGDQMQGLRLIGFASVSIVVVPAVLTKIQRTQIDGFHPIL